jgi:hypothetical protein
MNARSIILASLAGASTWLIGVSLAAAQQSLLGNPGLANAPRPSAIPVGHIARYQIPKYQSYAPGNGISRAFAVVAVRNANPAAGVTCGVSVNFRYSESSDACTVSLSIAPKNTSYFCTRAASYSSFPCFAGSQVAVCSPSLNGSIGNAIVASENTPGCEKIQVDAHQYFTRDANDAMVDSAFALRVFKAGSENEGD